MTAIEVVDYDPAWPAVFESIRADLAQILADVDVAVHAGDMICIEGPNGSGKTSLLRVLAGLSTPKAGRLARAGRCAFVPEKVGLGPATWSIAQSRCWAKESGISPGRSTGTSAGRSAVPVPTCWASRATVGASNTVRRETTAPSTDRIRPIAPHPMTASPMPGTGAFMRAPAGGPRCRH